MKLRESIKIALDEVVGVVPHIHETAEKIYRILLSTLENDNWTPSQWKSKKEKDFKFSGDFKMGEYDFTDVEFNLSIEEDDDKKIDLNRMAIAISVERAPDYDLLQSLENDVLVLQLVLDVNFDDEYVKNSGTDFGYLLKEYLESNKPTFISSLSHEIKHEIGRAHV